jgi:hypothetical protein
MQNDVIPNAAEGRVRNLLFWQGKLQCRRAATAYPHPKSDVG